MIRCSIRIFCSAIFAMLLVPALGAQTINVSNINIVNTPVPGSGHDYIKMLDETVNPANGALSVRVEAPVPKQRGDFSFPFYVFGYDSGGVMQPSASIFWQSLNEFSQATLNMKWTNSSMLGGGAGSTGGMFPGGFVANVGVGEIFFTQTSLSTQINANPLLFATCGFDSGYVYIDPFANRHAFNVGWDTMSGTSGGGRRL